MRRPGRGITDRFSLTSTDGPVDHVVVQCAAGHHFRMPSDMLPAQDRDLMAAAIVDGLLAKGTLKPADLACLGGAGVTAAALARRTGIVRAQSLAALLSDAGMPIEQISRLVGHSGTSTTETIYRKQIRPVIVQGADAMDLIFPAGRPE